jgi:hypothetical protein
MTSRRQFVKTGFLLGFASVSSVDLFAFAPTVTTVTSFPVTPAPARYLPELFIFDSRFPQARSHAAQIASSGMVVAASEGELTQLWTSLLQPRWKQGAMALAGLTTRSDLFVLETLAADYRMKVQCSEPYSQAVREETLYQWLIVPRSTIVQERG